MNNFTQYNPVLVSAKGNGYRTSSPAERLFYIDEEAGSILSSSPLPSGPPYIPGPPSAGSYPDFINLSTTDHTEGVDSSSECLSELAADFRSNLEWVNPHGDENLTYQHVFDVHRVVRNGMVDVTGQARPPTHLLKTLKNSGRNLNRDDMVGEGWFNYRNNQRRARHWALDITRYTTPKRANVGLSPDKGYAGDVGSDNSPLNLVYKRPHMPVLFKTEMQEPVRFCMFNTGCMRKTEFWDFLKVRLTPETLQGVLKVQAVRQPNRTCRMDFWVQASSAMGMKQALYLGSRQRRLGVRKDLRMPLYHLTEFWKPNKEMSRWRLDVFRPWRDRAPHFVAPKSVRIKRPKLGLATLNANGLHAKLPEFTNFVHERRIGIMAVQETLMGRNHYRLQVPGYEVFVRPKERGFRGQALLIDKLYPAFEVGTGGENFLIHVKVAGMSGEQPWHVLSIYLPSGGNCRSERTKCLNKMLREYKDIVDAEPFAAVVIMGDFNMQRRELSKRIKTDRTGLECLNVKGSGLTFHRKGTRWSDVDTILVSPTAKSYLTSAKVVRDWGLTSDHYPLATKLREVPPLLEKPKRIPRYRFNLDAIKGHGERVVNSNRWSCLPVDPIEDEESLDDAAASFDSMVNATATDLGIKRQILGRSYGIDRKLKRKVKMLAKLKRNAEDAKKARSGEADDLWKKYKQAQKTTRREISERDKKLKQLELKRIAKLYNDGEMRAFHRWEEQTTTGGKGSSAIKPIQDKHGKLLTNPEQVRERVYTYYKDLNQDDPEKLSRNKDYWKGRYEDRRPEPLKGINDPFEWRQVLLAIRKMALGTAPGHNDIPVEMFKSLLKEECHAALKKAGTSVGDNTYVALPEHLLPNEPTTEMGKALWRIIQGMWKVKRQPETWSKVTNKSLYKSGDPTNPKNYRGISLICVAMKIVTVMMANRISKTLEDNEILVTEQAGFRSSEEAVAQFVALAEMIRRRRLKDHKTYIVFIDFFKAFDKVMHEALFEKLEAMGFGGQFLDLLMSIYETSKACLRVGDKNSPYYDMLRGTRQGCPLSPILFIIFINDFLKYIPEGVSVPGMADGRKCPGLLFADDVAGLSETVDKVHALLDGVTRWSRDWKMPMGAPKCNVMLVAGTEEEQEALRNIYFEVDGQKIEATRAYKYLGIIISDKLGDKEQTDEFNHCKTLAARVKQAVNMRRGFLRDKSYPIGIKLAVVNSKILSLGTYGGEWIAFNQRRTKIIQKEIDIALKLILHSSSKSNLHAVKAMNWELGMTTVEERTSDLRLRLWHKAPKLKTWISLLVDKANRFVSKNNVWSKFTPVAIDRIEKQYLNISTGWIWDTLSQEGKVKYLPGDTENPALQNAKQRQEMKLRLTTRSFNRDIFSDKKVKATQLYAREAYFGYSRRYIRTAVNLPNLTEGTVWLARIRTSAWWDTNRRWDYLSKAGRDIAYIDRNICPCCKENFDDFELAHILLDCPDWNTERALWLQGPIDLLKNELDYLGNGVLTQEHARKELVYRLLGGYMTDGARVGLDVNKVSGNTSTLDLWAWGWGAHEEFKCPGFSVHGYVPVAKFLAAVMPRHKAHLFLDGRRVRDPLAYNTSSGDESPIKELRSWGPVSESANGDGEPNTEAEGLTWQHTLRMNQAEAPRGMARRVGTHAVLQISSSEGGDSEAQLSDNPGYDSLA